MTLNDALAVLRVDSDGGENDAVVASLLEAVPGYIRVATGVSENNQIAIPLCDTAAGFLLRLWYYPEGNDAGRLQTVVDSLMKSITVLGREINGDYNEA